MLHHCSVHDCKLHVVILLCKRFYLVLRSFKEVWFIGLFTAYKRVVAAQQQDSVAHQSALYTAPQLYTIKFLLIQTQRMLII